MKKTVSRRDFLRSGAAVAAGCIVGGATRAQGPKKRVIMLGFDGVEPTIIDEMLKRGELPNLAKVREAGAYTPLATTIPPQSPVAWVSFATSKNPGGHGVYDFVCRNTKTLFPAPGTSRTFHTVLGPDGSVQQPARSQGFRQGKTFWSVADDEGVRCKIFNVPFVYPADDLKNGTMLCGLDVPDLRGSTSTFCSFSDSFTPAQLEKRPSGGMRFQLNFKDNTAAVLVPGARDVKEKRAKYIEIAMKFTVDRTARTLSIASEGNKLTLKEGQWSEWQEWTFHVSSEHAVQAISRFHLVEAGEQVRLYMTCFQFHPRAPYIPFSHPKDFTAKLADRYGLFKTIGWSMDTHALRQDALPEDPFLEDATRTMDWRAALTLDELDRDDFDVLISAWTATDRVGHMFWRFRDPKHPLYTEAGAKKHGQALEMTYRKMDEIVGKVMAKLRENDLFIVLSDHGFETYRKGFNMNTWLVRNGYASVRGQTDPATASGSRGFLLDLDWSKTKAYAVGLSSVYLNIKGREAKGIVPSANAEALIQEIREKLLAVTDPDTGEKIFTAIYTRDVYSGTVAARAPDISLGYAKGYQNTKSTAKGAVPKELFDPNDDKWSGEHASSDAARVPGMLFINKALQQESPDIRDLSVTALEYSGVKAPEDYEGRNLV